MPGPDEVQPNDNKALLDALDKVSGPGPGLIPLQRVDSSEKREPLQESLPFSRENKVINLMESLKEKRHKEAQELLNWTLRILKVPKDHVGGIKGSYLVDDEAVHISLHIGTNEYGTAYFHCSVPSGTVDQMRSSVKEQLLDNFSTLASLILELYKGLQ
jgi:hypothetical protein